MTARLRIGAALAAGSLALAACSSSGGGSAPSESQLSAKLQKDSTITQLKSQLPAAAQTKFPAIVDCVAKALRKDANKSDLRDYVNDKKKLEDLGGNASKAQTDVKNCVTDVVKTG